MANKDTPVLVDPYDLEAVFESLDSSLNEELLYHGARAEVIPLIKQGGFRIFEDNDKSVTNGSLYGRGTYLAEQFSKSDEYCMKRLDDPEKIEENVREEIEDDVRYMILCKAALGNIRKSLENSLKVPSLAAIIDEGKDMALSDEHQKCSVVNGANSVSDKPEEDASDKTRSTSMFPSCWHTMLGDRVKLRGTYREFVTYHEHSAIPLYIIKYRRKYEYAAITDIWPNANAGCKQEEQKFCTTKDLSLATERWTPTMRAPYQSTRPDPKTGQRPVFHPDLRNWKYSTAPERDCLLVLAEKTKGTLQIWILKHLRDSYRELNMGLKELILRGGGAHQEITKDNTISRDSRMIWRRLKILFYGEEFVKQRYSIENHGTAPAITLHAWNAEYTVLSVLKNIFVPASKEHSEEDPRVNTKAKYLADAEELLRNYEELKRKFDSVGDEVWLEWIHKEKEWKVMSRVGEKQIGKAFSAKTDSDAIIKKDVTSIEDTKKNEKPKEKAKSTAATTKDKNVGDISSPEKKDNEKESSATTSAPNGDGISAPSSNTSRTTEQPTVNKTTAADIRGKLSHADRHHLFSAAYTDILEGPNPKSVQFLPFPIDGKVHYDPKKRTFRSEATITTKTLKQKRGNDERIVYNLQNTSQNGATSYGPHVAQLLQNKYRLASQKRNITITMKSHSRFLSEFYEADCKDSIVNASRMAPYFDEDDVIDIVTQVSVPTKVEWNASAQELIVHSFALLEETVQSCEYFQKSEGERKWKFRQNNNREFHVYASLSKALNELVDEQVEDYHKDIKKPNPPAQTHVDKTDKVDGDRTKVAAQEQVKKPDNDQRSSQKKSLNELSQEFEDKKKLQERRMRPQKTLDQLSKDFEGKKKVQEEKMKASSGSTGGKKSPALSRSSPKKDAAPVGKPTKDVAEMEILN